MIRIGTCGFSFKDWKGPVYPPSIKDSDMLMYYNKNLGFDTVEIDVSYYTPVSANAVKSWVKKTTDGFGFAVKCHKDMTLNEYRGSVLPEIDSMPIFDGFLRTFEPMEKSGKLITYLAQMGPVFSKNVKSKDYLKKFREKFGKSPLTVEFRHKSWLSEKEQDDTFGFLRDNNLGYAIVDEPSLRSLAPFVPKATDDTGYFRFHGRNKKWFEGNRETRYDYLYNDDELKNFLSPINFIAEQTKVTTIYFNNCHAGAAYVNAIRLIKMLGMEINRYDEPTGQLELPF
ncbi:MAG: DUF72 domain-containing protein [Firmicutes bacterium]|nr:DUF72 domain-containing protein [Bacillota bacterium]